MIKEYWLREEKKKIYRTQRAFVRGARYSFFDRVNSRLLVNLTTVKEDQDPDRRSEKYSKNDENELILTLFIATKIAHSSFLDVVRDEIFKNNVFEKIF
jgi:hypothetical protein